MNRHGEFEFSHAVIETSGRVEDVRFCGTINTRRIGDGGVCSCMLVIHAKLVSDILGSGVNILLANELDLLFFSGCRITARVILNDKVTRLGVVGSPITFLGCADEAIESYNLYRHSFGYSARSSLELALGKEIKVWKGRQWVGYRKG